AGLVCHHRLDLVRCRTLFRSGADLIKQGVRGEVVDARGLLVTPGWIDLHTHVYWGVAPLGVEADTHCVGRGVTTAVDAGSAGARVEEDASELQAEVEPVVRLL